MENSLPAIQFARIIALHNDVQPGEYFLSGDICTIGRSPICQIVVSGQPIVSRLHARIESDALRHVLHDADSANGTFVNNVRISEPYILKHHDEIGLGSPASLFRFVDPDATTPRIARLVYDEHSMTFCLNQQQIELTRGQHRLLLHLYRHSGQVCTWESCAQAIWGRDYDPGMDADALYRYVSKIRQQLRKLCPEIDFIQIQRGIGYKLVV